MTTAERASICDSAMTFLYGFPGGLESNRDRDKFLRLAKLCSVTKGLTMLKVIEDLLRAAYFQGRAVGRAAPEDQD